MFKNHAIEWEMRWSFRQFLKGLNEVSVLSSFWLHKKKVHFSFFGSLLVGIDGVGSDESKKLVQAFSIWVVIIAKGSRIEKLSFDILSLQRHVS